MDSSDHIDGEPVWQDHSSPDDARAAEFYSGLFGWTCPPGDPRYGGYRECTLDGKKVAGISPQMHEGPAAWSVYFQTADAAQTAERVVAGGGAVVVAPLAIADVGTMAMFTDPAGAFFGVWQPGTHGGDEVRNDPGSVCWYELVTTDVDGAGKFYEGVFGWKSHAHGPSNGYREFTLGDKMIGGLMAKPPSMPAGAPPYWGLYFASADTDATAKRAGELGGHILVEPTDIAPGRFAVVSDPTGAVFNLLTSSR